MELLRLVKPDDWKNLKEGLSDVLGTKAGEEAFARIVRRAGEEPVTVLGHGDKGVVYGLPSGKVLKVTSDEGELRAMNLLRGERHPNLVQVFDVFRVPVGAAGEQLGVVIREAVDRGLHETEGFDGLKHLLRENVFRANDLFNRRRREVHPRQALWEAMLGFKDELGGAAARELPAPDRILAEDLERALEALLGRQIMFIDAGPSNVGFIEDRPVLFDISLASVPEEAPDIELGRPKQMAGEP